MKELYLSLVKTRLRVETIAYRFCQQTCFDEGGAAPAVRPIQLNLSLGPNRLPCCELGRPDLVARKIPLVEA
jgi:hypothetical protein